MKRIISFFLMFAMCLSYASLTASFAADAIRAEVGQTAPKSTYSGKCGPNLTWSLDTETGVLTIEGTGNMTNYYNNGSPWDSYASYIKTIILSEGVTSIGDSAFYGCSSLKSINTPESVTSIGNYTFYGCSSIESITVPESVTSIGSDAFSGCSSLKSVDIPEGVTSIGAGAFSGCSSLEAVHITNIDAWCKISFGNVDSNPLYCAHNLYLNGELVTEVDFPEGVTSIGNSVFYGCSSLKSITIPEGVTSIGTQQSGAMTATTTGTNALYATIRPT